MEKTPRQVAGGVMGSDSTLINVIENFPVPASFKEADTGKYIVNNFANSRQFGIQNPKDLIGLTIHDVKFCQVGWGTHYANMIAALDFHAREKKAAVLGKHQFIDDNGEVQYEEMTKFPVLGSQQNILGIVTYRYDRTEMLSHSKLYQLYRDFYTAHESIKRVLACLNIEASFFILPTETQFRVFLAKAERYPNKHIAKFLGMSPRTVECHLDALRNKVVEGDLRRVLSLVKRSRPCAEN